MHERELHEENEYLRDKSFHGEGKESSNNDTSKIINVIKGTKTKGERTEVIYGSEKTTKMILKVLDNTSIKWDNYTNSQGPSIGMGVNPIRKGFKDAYKRGIIIRFITEINNSNLRYCEEFMKIAELRHLDNAKGGMAVTEKEYIATANLQETQPVAHLIYSNVMEIVEQQQEVFESLWEKAIPAEQRIREIREGQKNILVSKINNLKRKESASLTYLDWYNNLKNEILNEYGIKLEEEFSSFVRVFSDFKYYDYDAHQIVKEYKQIESLRYEMKSIQGIIESIIVTRDDLLGTIESLETEKSYSRLSLNALQELTYAGFGVEELKLLKNIIIEISLSNGISVSDAGKKFLKDVESQYDSKLGFESKITELQTELKKLEDEVPGYKEYLQSRVFISGALQYLYKYHVTDDDIINMTDIVTAYKDGNIILNSKLSTEDIVDENRLVKKKFYWKSLINEIINLGDINSQVAKQRSYLDLLKKETDDLNIGRQKLNEQILLSGQLLNSLSGQLTHFVESLKQIMSSAIELNQKIFILYQPYFFIHITISGSKGNNNKQKGE